MPQTATILRLNDASIGFQTKNKEMLLLESLNLDIKTGELTGLIGRNGSGKSTLLRTIVRLQKLLKGTIHRNDENIQDIETADFSRLLAYVASGIEFSETMTVRELVSMGRFPYTNWIGRLLASDIELIDEAMEKTGVSHLAGRKLIEISDGEKQKAMIARTLAQNTPLIVLDEPTAFLDLPSKYDIISLLYELTRKGKTVIYSTHDLNIAIRFSDTVWLIDNQKIHDGSPEDLILNNTIAGIFESDKIVLNPMTGDFDLRKQFSKKLSLNCTIPEIYYWTKQALQRSGYEVSQSEEEKLLISVELTDNKINWIVKHPEKSLRFNSIYELLLVLPKLYV